MAEPEDYWDWTDIDVPIADENWAGPEPADEYEEVPKRKFLWLGRHFSRKSTIEGWAVYSRASDARGGGRENMITLYDDGTWEYGIHG